MEGLNVALAVTTGKRNCAISIQGTRVAQYPELTRRWMPETTETASIQIIPAKKTGKKEGF